MELRISKLFFLLFCLPAFSPAQVRGIDYFINAGLQKNPTLLENTNLQQNFEIQKQLIAAQNKKPQINFTADYLFAPFFADNGRPISITNNPSLKAFGYDVGITNGGLYAAQFNVIIPLFNRATLDALYAQNKLQSDSSINGRKQVQYDAEKAVIDQYILSYQFLQQTFYLQQIIDRLRDRKPLVEALVKKGLLQQNDYLLLDIQLLNSINDLRQMQNSYTNGIALLKNIAFLADTNAVMLERPEIYLKPPPEKYYYLQKFELDSMNLIAQQNVFNLRYRPQVGVTGSGGVNATDITNAYRNVGVSAAVRVVIPIRDGGQRKLNDRSNAILLNNQRIYRDNAALLLANNLRNAKQQIDQWKETVQTDESLIKKQELLLDIIKDKVVQGQVTVMDYINALQDYNVMQKNKAVAQTSVLLYINLYNYYNH